MAGERTGQVDAFQLRGGTDTGQDVRRPGKFYEVEPFGGAPGWVPLPGGGFPEHRDLYVFARSKVRETARDLKGAGNSPPAERLRSQTGYRLAVEEEGPGTGRMNPCDHVQQSR